ncbi:MAG: hypothetical protein Q7S29_03865 [Candidatus Peribacter sp.]|nr:hypothetical protein [Candidatus Peribacter sp.]
MEAPDASERLYKDTPSGALARREKFLGKTTISELEEMQIFSSMQHVRKLSAENPNVHEMTREHAIDKLTTETLFRQYFPAWKGVKDIIATATEAVSFENGDIVYRLPNGDWLEPIFGQYIPASMPWAQLLEAFLRSTPPEDSHEKDGQSPVSELQADTARAAAKTTHEISR